jgi:phage gp46-like protein
MTDIALQWIDGEGDTRVNGADLLLDEGLETAVILSLFCDARAESSDVLPDGETHRRGWWGDQFSTAINDRTGSKLWMLWREKRVAATARRAQQYGEESLAWMKDDGIAESVSVAAFFESIAVLTGSAARPYEYALVLEVRITKPDGTRESFRFAKQWQEQAEKVH